MHRAQTFVINQLGLLDYCLTLVTIFCETTETEYKSSLPKIAENFLTFLYLEIFVSILNVP